MRSLWLTAIVFLAQSATGHGEEYAGRATFTREGQLSTSTYFHSLTATLNISGALTDAALLRHDVVQHREDLVVVLSKKRKQSSEAQKCLTTFNEIVQPHLTSLSVKEQELKEVWDFFVTDRTKKDLSALLFGVGDIINYFTTLHVAHKVKDLAGHVKGNAVAISHNSNNILDLAQALSVWEERSITRDACNADARRVADALFAAETGIDRMIETVYSARQGLLSHVAVPISSMKELVDAAHNHTKDSGHHQVLPPKAALILAPKTFLFKPDSLFIIFHIPFVTDAKRDLRSLYRLTNSVVTDDTGHITNFEPDRHYLAVNQIGNHFTTFSLEELEGCYNINSLRLCTHTAAAFSQEESCLPALWKNDPAAISSFCRPAIQGSTPSVLVLSDTDLYFVQNATATLKCPQKDSTKVQGPSNVRVPRGCVLYTSSFQVAPAPDDTKEVRIISSKLSASHLDEVTDSEIDRRFSDIFDKKLTEQAKIAAQKAHANVIKASGFAVGSVVILAIAGGIALLFATAIVVLAVFAYKHSRRVRRILRRINPLFTFLDDGKPGGGCSRGDLAPTSPPIRLVNVTRATTAAAAAISDTERGDVRREDERATPCYASVVRRAPPPSANGFPTPPKAPRVFAALRPRRGSFSPSVTSVTGDEATPTITRKPSRTKLVFAPTADADGFVPVSSKRSLSQKASLRNRVEAVVHASDLAASSEASAAMAPPAPAPAAAAASLTLATSPPPRKPPPAAAAFASDLADADAGDAAPGAVAAAANDCDSAEVGYTSQMNPPPSSSRLPSSSQSMDSAEKADREALFAAFNKGLKGDTFNKHTFQQHFGTKRIPAHYVRALRATVPPSPPLSPTLSPTDLAPAPPERRAEAESDEREREGTRGEVGELSPPPPNGGTSTSPPHLG